MSNQIHWTVDGMTCTGCVNKVTKYLQSKGLSEVVVDLAGGSIDFELPNHDHGSITDIQQGVESLGYTVGSSGNKTWWTLEKKLLISAIFTIPLIVMHFIPSDHDMAVFTRNLLLSLIPITIGLIHFGRSAFAGLRHGSLDMDLLIFIGGFSATLYSVVGYVLGEINYDFFETAASIFTIVLFGNYLESRAIGRTREFINKLSHNFPTSATVVENGEEKERSISKIGIGDIIKLKKGSIIPLDGKIFEGKIEVDESMVSGESEWIIKKEEENVFSGSTVYDGNALVRVHSLESNSTLQNILLLVRKAELSKPNMQRIADKVSSIFVPLVLFLSLLTFLITYFFFSLSMSQAIMRSVAVLVISCPCALGLATPAAVAVGISEALKRGILIKRADVMEVMTKAKYFILDKTGTLTQPSVEIIDLGDNGDDYVPFLKALVEKSAHPLSLSVREKLADNNISKAKLIDIQEIAGKGIRASDEAGNLWMFGSVEFVGADESNQKPMRSYLTKNNTVIAGIRSSEMASDAVIATVKKLKKIGETIILSGDKAEKVEPLAKRLSIDNAQGGMSPIEKLNTIKDYANKDITVMVGDGINDSAAMSAAHVGISMNDSSKVVASSADVVLTGKRFEKLSQLISISDRTVLNIKQNIFWAFSYNLVAIPLAAMGMISPMWAALFMAFSDIVIIVNAIRFKFKPIV